MDPQSLKTPTTPKGEDNQDNVSDTDLFDHIIFTVCQFFTKERADYLMKWMKYHGFENITHVISYMQTNTEESMKELTQYKVNKQTHDLQGPTRQQIKLLAYWATYKTNEIQDELSNSDWMNLTRKEFNTWRINTDFSKGPPSQVPVSPMKSPSSVKSVSTVTAASQSQQDLTAFRKGTKRDATAYEVFKDERYYDSFWRVFKTTAKAQGLSNVLNFKYTPPHDDEYAEELFQEQQVFLYSVLVRIIQTDQGRAYVREHEHDEDARAVLQKLHSLHTESDLAKREVLRLTNYISNLRLDDTWRGTTRQFLLHFQEQLRLLDNLVTLSDRIPDHTRMTFLMQAVEKVPDLRRVKILDNVVNTKSGAKSLCYQSYFRLLLDAAYDHDQATQSSVHSRRRHVKQHESLYGQDTDADITSQDDMEYHVHNTKATSESPSSSSKVSLPRDLWFKLSEEDRKLIIEYNKMIQAPSSTTPRTVQTHALDIDPEPDPDPNQVVSDDNSPGVVTEHSDDSDPVTQFINQAMTTDINHPATDLTSVLSNAKSKTSKKVTFKANMHKQAGHVPRYLFSRKSTLPGNQLIDRGANGGLAGSDMRILSKTGRHITIVGIDNHELTGLPVVTCAAKFETNDGPIVGIFNEYAYYGKGLSIHAPGQFEHFGLAVDERSVKVDGKQRITTLDGRAIPLHIKDGLAYIHSLGIPSDDDMDTLPQIIFTSPDTWDPGVLDHSYSPTSSDNDPDWKHVKTDGSMSNHPYDNYGEYTDRVVCNLNLLLDLPYDHGPDDAPFFSIYADAEGNDPTLHASVHRRYQEAYDWKKFRPFFGWQSEDVIADTFKHTTRNGSITFDHDTLKKHFKARNPVLNIPRRHEPVATDSVFSDTPAVDHGGKVAQIFVGRDTLVTDIYGIKSTKQFVNTLQDHIRFRGAMETLISDGGSSLISQKVKDILRTLLIGEYRSEPYHQHQNKAENRYQTVKRMTNALMNATGCPANTWLLCLEYVCDLLNHTSSPTHSGRTPLEALSGRPPDITHLLFFPFWDEVYYRVDPAEPNSGSYPSSSDEKLGHWVGFAHNVGDSFTWKILTQDNQIIYRSAVRRVESTTPNLRVDRPSGEDSSDKDDNDKQADTVFIRSDSEDPSKPMPTIDFDDMIGRTFLCDTEENGERHRARVIKRVIDLNEEATKQEERVKYIYRKTNSDVDEMISYNQLMEYIERDNQAQTSGDNLFRFRDVIAHQGPLNTTDPDYKGSKYNLLVDWETGETTYEPLSLIANDDPITVAIYGKKHDLLNEPGWKHLKRYVKTSKRLIRAAKQSRIKQVHHSVKYKFGFQVPRNYEEAVTLDKQHGNTKWQDATELELSQIQSYKTFKDFGKAIFIKGKVSNAPEGYHKIRVHLVFDVKHDGRHKARLVADGHLTKEPVETIYSGVVSIRNLRIALFLGTLNDLEIWGADIGNAYLEALTGEKLFIVAGPEFKELEGHILIIYKALYGLKSSGARWHDVLFDVLTDMGFSPSKADPDIWMRKAPGEDCYEYIAVYVDDLAIISTDPGNICKILKEKYNFKLKGDGPIDFHLGCCYTKDSDGTLVADPRRYIGKMMDTFERIFKKKPKKAKTPLIGGDHPELDDSELLDEEGTNHFQTLIGQLQWVITIGRFDVFTATMTLSRFRAAPRKGHLDRAKRIYGYLAHLPEGAIRFRIGEPDYSSLPTQEFDWTRTVYSNASERIPEDCPTPLGRYVTTTHYVDANLMHDIVTGKSVTAVLHLLNGTPIDWYSKRQSTVETATYGSEFVAARTAIDQITELRHSLRYLGVPIRERSYMYGDNRSVVLNATVPHSILSKRHHLLSYHRVREAIAAKYVAFYWKDGKTNPADILSKHWDFVSIWPMLKPLLFWKGEVQDLNKSNDDKAETTSCGEC